LLVGFQPPGRVIVDANLYSRFSPARRS